MASPPSHSQSLLPNPGILLLDSIERDKDRFRLMVHVEQEPKCPVCGETSRNRHSSYSGQSRQCVHFPLATGWVHLGTGKIQVTWTNYIDSIVNCAGFIVLFPPENILKIDCTSA